MDTAGRRQARIAARHRTMRCLALMCQLAVLPVNFLMLTDLRRLRWLASQLRAREYSERAVAGALIVDWAVRCPAFTRKVLQCSSAGTERALTCTALVQLMQSLYADQPWPSFWGGRAKSHLKAAVPAWSPQEVSGFGRQLVSGQGGASCRLLIARLRQWPCLGSYLSVSAVRAVSLAMNIRMHDMAPDSSSMSLYTSLLCSLVPFDQARASLSAAGISEAAAWDDGWIAYLYCEFCKVLRSADVLQPLISYRRNTRAFAADLSNDRMASFLRTLQHADMVGTWVDRESEATQTLVPHSYCSAVICGGGSVRRYRHAVAALNLQHARAP